MPYCILALLLLAQQPSDQQKHVAALLAQIQRLAVSEPAVYGIDTRLRTAEVLTKKYPKLAIELLQDARAELSGVNIATERDRMRVRLVRAFAPLDLEEAERLTRSFPRGTEQDYVAQSYDQLYMSFEKSPAEARQMVSKGLRAGGFRMVSAARMLAELKSKDTERATALFAEILGAFPAESPRSEDVKYLLEQTRQIVGLNRLLALEAIDKALNAATSESLRIPVSASKEQDASATRETMLREVVALLKSIDPDLLKRYKDHHKELDLPAKVEPEPKPKDEKKEEELPALDSLPYADALALVRQAKDLGMRTGGLIDISRRPELSSQQRSSVAMEALSTAGKLPVSGDRLFGLALISRDFARHGEWSSAGLAAQMLSETYAKACECGAMTCVHAREEYDCMQNVEDFAEYLDEFKIDSDALSLNNISLQARLLVLKLHALLEAK